jgi:hypothetical protein
MTISQNFPSIDPTLRLNFQGARRLDPRVTFTRASTATYVDEDGLIKTTSADQARFDYDPVTGESLGLLIEESRTNLITYSEDFSQSVWIKQNGFSITSNTAIAPDGTLTADTASIVNVGSDFLYTNITYSGSFTISCWVRTVSGSSTFKMGTYNGSDGSIFSPSYTATEEWQRFSFNASVISVVSGFYPCVPDVSGAQFYIWGAQVEAGSFPTSYIPTSGSAVTRSGDFASVSGTNFLNFYNHSEGTYIIDYKRGYAGTNTPIFNLPALLYSYSLLVFSVIQEGEYVKNQNANVQSLVGSATTSTFRKLAIVYNSSSYGGCISGGNVVVGSGGFNSSQDSYIAFGIIQGATLHRIKSLTYYPERLSDSQLQNLTK